jgi:hypothetical protein
MVPGRTSGRVAQRKEELSILTVLQRTTNRVSNRNFEKDARIPEKFKLTFVVQIHSS